MLNRCIVYFKQKKICQQNNDTFFYIGSRIDNQHIYMHIFLNDTHNSRILIIMSIYMYIDNTRVSFFRRKGGIP